MSTPLARHVLTQQSSPVSVAPSGTTANTGNKNQNAPPEMLAFTATASPGVRLIDPSTPIDAPASAMSTAELDFHLTAILGAMDPLDAHDFDPIEYINAIFPTGTLFLVVV
jgi:hypothetical protein